MKAKDIITTAWKQSGLSQQDFAKEIKKSQPMLSKYMSGSASPPADIIILCMNKCGLQLKHEISASELANRILVELADNAFSETRSAINQILNSIAQQNDTIARN
ncbi:MAG TPA: helix-turn-helix transcriptional regulator [Herbaspirillum sp.]|uniref:helix-turn-helix domain-containing protein n=1 Tax=Herbaspirillum sp. TaxID=1890675 RepID=UPI002D5C3FA9|nr:helix-turn-helix transcriptional regulator [Herbaspirillum sp.]HZG18628.1 helix-turn-helix transcriptional regulator [Herbaspirillum sp.]